MMTRRLQREVKITVVPRTWLGRLLAGMVGFGVLALALVFFTVLLIAAGALGVALLIYILHAQYKAQRDASDSVIDGEYTVESSEQEHNDKITEETPKSQQRSP